MTHTPRGNSDQVQLVIGDHRATVMLFPVSALKNFTKHEIVDTMQATEVLLFIDADSKEEVDEIAKRAVIAGGTIFGEPSENQGWMYGYGLKLKLPRYGKIHTIRLFKPPTSLIMDLIKLKI